jgi:hypothetical protein
MAAPKTLVGGIEPEWGKLLHLYTPEADAGSSVQVDRTLASAHASLLVSDSQNTAKDIGQSFSSKTPTFVQDFTLAPSVDSL